MEKDYLILKRASVSRPSGEWNDDDYDVLANGEVVGRIFKANAAPVGSPWMWTLTFPHHAPHALLMAADEAVERRDLAAAEPLDKLAIGIGQLGHSLHESGQGGGGFHVGLDPELARVVNDKVRCTRNPRSSLR